MIKCIVKVIYKIKLYFIASKGELEAQVKKVPCVPKHELLLMTH